MNLQTPPKEPQTEVKILRDALETVEYFAKLFGENKIRDVAEKALKQADAVKDSR